MIGSVSATAAPPAGARPREDVACGPDRSTGQLDAVVTAGAPVPAVFLVTEGSAGDGWPTTDAVEALAAEGRVVFLGRAPIRDGAEAIAAEVRDLTANPPGDGDLIRASRVVVLLTAPFPALDRLLDDRDILVRPKGEGADVTELATYVERQWQNSLQSEELALITARHEDETLTVGLSSPGGAVVLTLKDGSADRLSCRLEVAQGATTVRIDGVKKSDFTNVDIRSEDTKAEDSGVITEVPRFEPPAVSPESPTVPTSTTAVGQSTTTVGETATPIGGTDTGGGRGPATGNEGNGGGGSGTRNALVALLLGLLAGAGLMWLMVGRRGTGGGGGGAVPGFAVPSYPPPGGAPYGMPSPPVLSGPELRPAPPARREWLIDLGPADQPGCAGIVPGGPTARVADLGQRRIEPIDGEEGRNWYLPAAGVLGLAGWLEKKPGRGEDAEPSLRLVGSGRGLVGTYDGSGGAGSAVARTLRDGTPVTQASVAARLVRDLTEQWFVRTTLGGYANPPLQQWLADGLAAEQLQLPKPEVEIRGRLHRVLPTTMATAMFQTDLGGVKGRTGVDAQWAGDSRVFVLSPIHGLQVLTRDDTREQDALELIRNDQPMTNLVSADRPFTVNHRSHQIEGPVVLLSATDGCFGYVETPAVFEYLVLRSLLESGSVDAWPSCLLTSISRFAGDDASFSAVAIGFSGFADLADAFGPRFDLLDEDHFRRLKVARQQDADAFEQERITSWERYRAGYEGLLLPVPDDRG